MPVFPEFPQEAKAVLAGRIGRCGDCVPKTSLPNRFHDCNPVPGSSAHKLGSRIDVRAACPLLLALIARKPMTALGELGTTPRQASAATTVETDALPRSGPGWAPSLIACGSGRNDQGVGCPSVTVDLRPACVTGFVVPAGRRKTPRSDRIFPRIRGQFAEAHRKPIDTHTPEWTSARKWAAGR
jgi:hypothetical protein